MKINPKVEISVKNSNGQDIHISTHSDSTIDEWKDIFKTILIFETFHPDLIKEMFNEE